MFFCFSERYRKKAEHEIGCEIESIDVSIHGTCAECAKIKNKNFNYTEENYYG